MAPEWLKEEDKSKSRWQGAGAEAVRNVTRRDKGLWKRIPRDVAAAIEAERQRIKQAFDDAMSDLPKHGG